VIRRRIKNVKFSQILETTFFQCRAVQINHVSLPGPMQPEPDRGKSAIFGFMLGRQTLRKP